MKYKRTDKKPGPVKTLQRVNARGLLDMGPNARAACLDALTMGDVYTDRELIRLFDAIHDKQFPHMTWTGKSKFESFVKSGYLEIVI